MKKILAGILAAILLMTVTAGCMDKDPSLEKVIQVQFGAEPATLDPALCGEEAGDMLLLAFDCLVNLDQNDAVIPGAAESWHASEDGLIWTFTLQEDQKWSDGSDLTAEDFVYSWKRLAVLGNAAPLGESALGRVKGYREATGGDGDALAVEALDDVTLQVTLSSPCAWFDKLCAMPVLSPINKATLEANGDIWAASPETYISNGPFYLKEYVAGSHMLFVKNKHYRDADRVNLDGIRCLMFSDANAAFAAYKSGEAMFIRDIPMTEVQGLIAVNDPEFHRESRLGTYTVCLNSAKAPLKDSRVRMALSLALDRQKLAENVTYGTYQPASGLVGTGFLDWDGSSFSQNANEGKAYVDLKNPKANLKKAKKLLAEAGYPAGKGFPALTLLTTDSGFHTVIAGYLQNAWKALGIELKIVPVADENAISAKLSAGDFMLCRRNLLCDYNDPAALLEQWVSGNGGGYHNSRFDEWMEKAAKTTDAKTRFGYLHQAEDLLMADAACIPLGYDTDCYLQSSRITGAWHSPCGLCYLMFADIAE